MMLRAGLAFFALGTMAHAQTLSQPYGSQALVTATGSTTARSLAARAGDVINVKDYGAACDDSTDDTAAINAAFAAARARQANVPIYGSSPIVAVTFAGGRCKITGPINVTNFVAPSLLIDGRGTVIDAQMSGGVAFDAMGSRFLNVQNLEIIGNPSFTAGTGFQIGRTASGVSADLHTFRNVVISGKFTRAAFYNLASETNSFDKVIFTNSNTTSSYAVILDGVNHWNASSTFVTITTPVDSAQSFNENLFTNSEFISSSDVGAIWTAASGRHRFLSSYVATHSHGMTIDSSIAATSMLDVDTHFETSASTDVFFLTGTTAATVIEGLNYRDHYSEPSSSVFAIDAGSSITSVKIRNANIQVQQFLSGSAVMFDQPSKYTLSGYVYVPTAASWNTPATFNGVLITSITTSGLVYQPGTANAAGGPSALLNWTSGTFDTAFGQSALKQLTTGSFNTAFGGSALQNVVGGSNNSAFGFGALVNNTGSSNTAFGVNSCKNISSGGSNVCFGNATGNTLTTGSSNILLGLSADVPAAATSNMMNLGGLLFYNTNSTAAPTVSGGTSPTIDSHANNRSGTATFGTGAVTSGTITLAGTGYSTWNHCRVTSQSALTSFAYSYTLTAIAVTAASLTGATIDYDCDGY